MSQLKISTRTLRPKDLDPVSKTGGKFVQLDLKGYIPVFQWGYGRMDESSPGKGLSTWGVASCISVVLHCRETKRTILTHSPNYLQLQPVFGPMVEWIIGGSPKLDEEVPQNPLAFMMKEFELLNRVKTSGGVQHTIQAVVIRGYEYSTPQSLRWGHEGWMRDFRELFATFGVMYSVTADILDCPKILTTGALTVDKENAEIKFLDFARNSNIKKQPLKVVDTSISAQDEYSIIQQTQDLFVGTLLGVHMAKDTPGINLQYDVDHYLLPLKLTDEARYLIRSKGMGESQDSQIQIIQKFGLSDNWIKKKGPAEDLVRMTYSNIMKLGPPCERCGKRGTKKCAECKAAWYCSVDHQREDWRNHKPWCRANKLQ